MQEDPRLLCLENCCQKAKRNISKKFKKDIKHLLTHQKCGVINYQFVLQISAQESRRKKKEYMDCLERKMQGLNNDLESFKQKCSSLDNQNMSLRAQVQQLQAQLANKSGIKEPNV
jgi:predicted RNase H-like nuclease (RuvC/YqgF family)